MPHSAALCGNHAMASKKRLTVNLDCVEYHELQKWAERHSVSMAWLGRQAIVRLLEQHKQREFEFPLDINQSAKS